MSEECEKYADGTTHISKENCSNVFYKKCSEINNCSFKLNKQLLASQQQVKILNEEIDKIHKEFKNFPHSPTNGCLHKRPFAACDYKIAVIRIFNITKNLRYIAKQTLKEVE